jgi:antitoxin component YwqK of YwqJK toxin-antitoxin module
MEGEWTYYDEQGAKSSTANALHDDANGFKEEYYPSGKIEFLSKYKSGYNTRLIQYDTTGKVIADIDLAKGTGKVVLKHFNGKVLTEYNYVNGHMDGLYRSYYPDGSLQVQDYYKNGLDDSTYTFYFFGGKVAVEGKYHLGNKVGDWKNYRSNGTLTMTEHYENGAVNGKRIYYYENGKPDTEMSMEDGDREGPTKKYSLEGQLLYILNYRQGLVVSYTYPDASGKLLPEIPVALASTKCNTYYSNGKISSTFSFADGKSNGPDLLFFPDGKPWLESTVEYGNTEGKYKSYFPSGQLNAEYNYEDDNLQGPYKEYYEKGILKEEGFYYNGYLQGERKYYDESGKLKETRTYYYGKLLSVKK